MHQVLRLRSWNVIPPGLTLSEPASYVEIRATITPEHRKSLSLKLSVWGGLGGRPPRSTRPVSVRLFPSVTGARARDVAARSAEVALERGWNLSGRAAAYSNRMAVQFGYIIVEEIAESAEIRNMANMDAW